MTFHLVATFTALLFYLVFGLRQMGFLSASSLMVYMQFNMSLGALPLLDPSREDDRVYADLLVGTFIAIVLVSTVLSFTVKRPGAPFTGEVLHREPTRPMWFMVLVSIGICSLYYASVGYIAFFESFQSVVAGDDTDIAGLRLASYAGTSYFLPGYVNQFKNVLLPALTVVLLTYAFAKKVNWRGLLAIALTPIAVVFILGTGQRGAFVTFMIAVGVYIYLLNPKRAPKRFFWLGMFALPLLTISTFALGRSRTDLQAAEGTFGQIFVLLSEIFGRLTNDNQGAGIIGFHYIYTQPTQWGAQWADTLYSLLPGVRGTTSLDSYIFSIVYGSSRGTMPPSIWGSAYYNWGFAGAIVIAMILAIIAFALSTAMRSREGAVPLELFGYGGVTVILTAWIAGTPAYLFNAGIGAFAVMWIWGRRQSNRALAERVVPDISPGLSDAPDSPTQPRQPQWQRRY